MTFGKTSNTSPRVGPITSTVAEDRFYLDGLNARRWMVGSYRRGKNRKRKIITHMTTFREQAEVGESGKEVKLGLLD